MKVVALATYPVEAAATRYRLVQFIAPLAERRIALDVRPFLSARQFAALYRRGRFLATALGLVRSIVGRLGDLRAAWRADVLLVQREAMIVGPPLFEWLATRLGGPPLVLDLDDATYLRYPSPTYGRLGTWLKGRGKTDRLIGWSRAVVCGSAAIAEYVKEQGKPSLLIPTVVDTARFRPRDNSESPRVPVLGWIGTHSTFAYLESIFPALEALARTHPFHLRIIGSGRRGLRIPGVSVETRAWSLEREVADFQSFDIGLYPVAAGRWAAGKSGFKAIQYMAVGIPYVVSPVGACAEIGAPGSTHLVASSPEEWRAALARLLASAELRRHMGAAGRGHVIEHYSLAAQADKLARLLAELTRRPR